MTLGELIEALRAAPQDRVIKIGFRDPHSYRGYYEQLAFEQCGPRRVSDMLASAEFALDRQFQGYKGGEYVMKDYTDVWLANWGSCGEQLSSLLLRYMLADEHDGPPEADGGS